MLAYRLIRGENIVFPRSACPACAQVLPWYDLIPLFSWIVLRGACRFCQKPISWLYPFIEMLTAVVLSAAYLQFPMIYFVSYFLFFSALIVSIRSDLETLLISRFVTLFLIPFGLLFSSVGLLPISVIDSSAGALFGYLFLYCVTRAFYFFTGKWGMGHGDFELLAFIGSFTGLVGVWMTLLFGSLTGSLIGIVYIVMTGQSSQCKIPFGPFLACGAIVYVFLQQYADVVLFFNTLH